MLFRSTFRFSSLLRRTATTLPSPVPVNPFYRWAKRLTLPTIAMTYYAFMPGTLNQK